jgi:hypothetical protein
MQVNAEHVGEAHEFEDDRRHLLGDPRLERVFLGGVPCIGSRQPPEQFAELADLTSDGEDQRLRVVEWLPVALACEGTHALTNVLKISHKPTRRPRSNPCRKGR